MSCTLCDARERSGGTGFHLLPATAEMGDRLVEILAEHQVAFERNTRLIAIVGPQNHARIVALLRQILSEPERRAVSVFAGDGSEFPHPRLLDEWWRVHETNWFARALAEDRFATWFQPIVDTSRQLSQQRVLGHECLIRLNFGRNYSGAEILDAAWVRDEMHVFDAHARSLAIRSAARELRLGQSRDAVFFVNFMPSSIYNPELCLATTMQALQESGLRPQNIVFEVVESELVRDRAHLHRICDFYRSHGFGLALDDLGAGVESQQMLRELRPDFVKLDKALVRNVERPLSAATIRKLVDLSDRAGIPVIAKGVERTHVMENLWLLGVQCMQGYLFGRPGPSLHMQDNDLMNLAAALDRESCGSGKREAVPALAIN